MQKSVRSKHSEALEAGYVYLDMIEGVGAGIIVFQRNKVVFVNRMICEVGDISKEKLMEFGIEKVIHPEDRSMALERIRKREKGEPVYPETAEIRVIRPSGEIRWIEIRSTQIYWEGEKAVLGFAIDITERKKIEVELAKYRLQLEILVQKRTNQLEEQLGRVREAESKVRQLSERLLVVQEKERREIGNMLHDEVGGTLSMLRLALDKAEKKLDENGHAVLDEINQIINEMADQIRFVSHTVRPAMLDDFGLEEALDWYFGRFQIRTGIKIFFQHDGLESRLGEQVETTAYRVIQEALTNVAKHAQAEQINVNLSYLDAVLTGSIIDSGSGFDVQLDVFGTGIRHMRDLVELAGGSFEVDSSLGSGTAIRFSIPVNNENSGTY